MIDIVYPQSKGKWVFSGKEGRLEFLQRIYSDKRFRVIQIIENSYWDPSGTQYSIYAIVELI